MQFFAVIAVGLGLLVAVFNWTTPFRSRDDKHVSPVPLVGGALIAIGLLAFETTRPYWWLAVFIDFGTFGLLVALPMLVGEALAHADRNARHIFASTIDDRTVSVRLFKNGDCVIDVSFDPPRPHGNYGSLAVSAGFVGKWSSQNEHFDVVEYASGRTLRISPNERGGYTLTEQYPDGDDPSIYALDEIDVDAKRLTIDG